jgi:ubiquinone/menaquinone biosynthesis C-methylase UbiE
MDAAEANRRFYETVAAEYDREEAIANPRAQALLRDSLRRALDVVCPKPAALDACGGSGNVSELLVGMGVLPVLVDVSPEMVELWREKARRAGMEPEIVVAEIADFLRADPRRWDLVVFSSALHHLESYEDAVAAAAERLNPGGVLVTIFDPPLAERGDRALRRLDWVLFQAVHEPRDFVETVRNRLRRATADEPAIGRMAERHALSGIDDLALRWLLEDRGFEIVVHERLPEARMAPMRALLRISGRDGAFRLIARRG